MKALRLVRAQPIAGAVIVMSLITMMLAAFVPVLAPIPEASAGWTAPPLPDRDEPLGDFQHLLESFPVVVRDSPDEESRSFLAVYDTATFGDLLVADSMLNAAIDALDLPPDMTTELNIWITELTSPNLSWLDPVPVPNRLLTFLTKDPRNADLLNNLGVALYYKSVSFAFVGRPAAAMFEGIVEYFPESRAVVLNTMFLNTNASEKASDFSRWFSHYPNDVAAIQLAVYRHTKTTSVRWSGDIEGGWVQRNVEVLIHSSDPATSAFGLALMGDVRLATAVARRESAPFQSRQDALAALKSYDSALVISDDPALYSGRAMALEVLGDHDAAIQAQERAVELDPDSDSLRLRLAELYMRRRGTESEIMEWLDRARVLLRQNAESDLARQPVPVTAALVRNHYLDSAGFVSSNPGKYFFAPHPVGMAGGVYAISFELIPSFETRTNPLEYGTHTPSDRAAYFSAIISAILADPAGVEAEAESLERIHQAQKWVPSENGVLPGSLRSYVSAAHTMSYLTGSAKSEPVLDLSWPGGFATLLRLFGLNKSATSYCELHLDELGDDEHIRSTLLMCVGVNSYLTGDFEEADRAFLELDDPLLIGYMAETQGDLDKAINRYRVIAESNADEQPLALLRLAGATLDSGDEKKALELYDQFFAWLEANPYGIVNMAPLPTEIMTPQAHSNRGIARLQMSADRNGNIGCNDGDHDVCIAAAKDFDAALGYDAYNPIFLMNRAWVARLMGDHELSTQLMSRALESDPTLYPVLVDMGVIAAQNNDPQTARQYFLDAVAANPKYDLGWWNLGVLEMQKGPGGVLRGQAYLARAIKQNPSLATSSLNFKTDESIYRVEITEQDQPGAGWAFSTASSLATTALGAMGVLLIMFHASRDVFKDRIVEEFMSRTESVRPWIDKNIRPHLAQFRAVQTSALGLLALTIVVMILVAVIPAWRGDPGTAAASITVALFALALAVITHEFGHRLSARLMNAELEPVQWAPGLGLALVLLPFNLSSGPFPAQRVKSNDDTTTLWVYLFGPLANLGVAALAYIVYLNQPLPVLRVITITQLAVMSYSLLPFEPLDGAPLSRAQPKLVGGLASMALLAGVLFSVGMM